MGKIIALIFAVIGLIFIVMVALVGLGVVEHQPMIEFAQAIADVFRSFGTVSAVKPDTG